MIQFNSPYDFYNLPEVKRIDLIGDIFRLAKRSGVYIPIHLVDADSNYGIAQGVLYVSEIYKIPLKHQAPNEGKMWFKVGAFSPDDLDMDLEFFDKPEWFRKNVITFLLGRAKIPTSYRQRLKEVQQEFETGELYI
jgi:hypothetical protein